MSQKGYSDKYLSQTSNTGKKKTINQPLHLDHNKCNTIQRYITDIKHDKQQQKIRQYKLSRNQSQLIYNYLIDKNENEINAPGILDQQYLNAFAKLRQKLKRYELAQRLFSDDSLEICHKIHEEDRIIQSANTFNVIKRMLIGKKFINKKEYKYAVSEQNYKLIHMLESKLIKPLLDYDSSQIQDEFIHILEKLRRGQTPLMKSKNRFINSNRILSLLTEIQRGLGENQSQKKIGQKNGNPNNSKLSDKIKQYQIHLQKSQKQITSLKNKIRKLKETLADTKTAFQQQTKRFKATKQEFNDKSKQSLLKDNRKVRIQQLKGQMLALTGCIIKITHENQNHKLIKQNMNQIIFAGQEERSRIRIQFKRLKQELADKNHQFCQLQAYCSEIEHKNNELIQEASLLKDQMSMRDQQIERLIKDNQYYNNRQNVQEQAKQSQIRPNFDQDIITPLKIFQSEEVVNNQPNKSDESKRIIEEAEECEKCNTFLQNINKLEGLKKQSQCIHRQNQNLVTILDKKQKLIAYLQGQNSKLSFRNSELVREQQYAFQQKYKVDLQLSNLNTKHLQFKQQMMKQFEQNKTKYLDFNSQLSSLIQSKQRQLKSMSNQLKQLRDNYKLIQLQSSQKTDLIKLLQQDINKYSQLQSLLILAKLQLNNCKISLQQKQNQLTTLNRKFQLIVQIKSELNTFKTQLQQEIKNKFDEQSRKIQQFKQLMNKKEILISQALREELNHITMKRDSILLQLLEYKTQLEKANMTISVLTKDINQQRENNKVTMIAHTTIIEDQRKVHKLQKDELQLKIKQLSQQKYQKDLSSSDHINEITNLQIQEIPAIAKIENNDLIVKQGIQQAQLKMNNMQQSGINYINSTNESKQVHSEHIYTELIEDLKSKIAQKDIQINLLLESEGSNLKMIEVKQNQLKEIREQLQIQRLNQQNSEKKIAVKVSDNELKIKILQQQIQQLKEKLRLISIQLSKKSNISDLQVDLLFQNNIFDDMLDYKRFLKETLQKHTRYTIRSTKLIFSFDPHNKTNFHQYVKEKANILLIIRMMNGYYLACYSEAAFSASSKEKKNGLIISITNRDVFPLVSSDKKAISYDEYYLIFGNSQVRIKSQENKVFSNFGIQNQSYSSRGKKVDWLLGGDKNEREQDLEYYQIYQLNFYDF